MLLKLVPPEARAAVEDGVANLAEEISRPVAAVFVPQMGLQDFLAGENGRALEAGVVELQVALVNSLVSSQTVFAVKNFVTDVALQVGALPHPSVALVHLPDVPLHDVLPGEGTVAEFTLMLFGLFWFRQSLALATPLGTFGSFCFDIGSKSFTSLTFGRTRRSVVILGLFLFVGLLELDLDDGHGVVGQRGRKVVGVFSFARNQDFSGTSEADLVRLTSGIFGGVEGRSEDFRVSNEDVSVEVVAGLSHKMTKTATARCDVLHGIEPVTASSKRPPRPQEITD